MADFPENDLAILRDYFPGNLAKVVAQVRDELLRIVVNQIDRSIDENEEPDAVNTARIQVLRFLNHASFDAVKDEIANIYENIRNREFSNAILGVNNISTVEFDRVNKATFSTAFRPTQLIYIERQFKPDSSHPLGQKELRIARILESYDGPQIDPDHFEPLLAFQALLRGKREFKFRSVMLRAESQFGLRKYRAAIKEYSKLLPKPVDLPVSVVGSFSTLAELTSHASSVLLETSNLANFIGEEFVAVPEHALIFDDSIGVPAHVKIQRKLAAIRCGFAHLARGDRIYRKARNLTDDQHAKCSAAYDAAVTVLKESNVSADNPLRQQIAAYAEFQKLKLDAGFNYLGYKDSYVPILRRARLRKLALDRVDAAQNAADRFQGFKEKAANIDDALAEYRLALQVAEKTVEIADGRSAQAELQGDLLDERLSAISDAKDFLTASTLVSGFGAFLQVNAPGSTLTGAGAVSGIANGIVGFLARRNELEHQQRSVEIEGFINRREQQIAQLEKQIAEFRLDFAESQRQIVENRALNSDRYYKLSNIFEALAESHLDVAILWAFLYERAIAFKRLKPDLDVVKFDYLDSLNDILAAPAALKNDVTVLDERDVPETQGQFLVETLSLRARYPIEFGQFLQTGRMDFAISLYDLDKIRPGVFERRITGITVEIVGLIPATGFAGRLIHHGTFLLRDKASTLDPNTTRLIPTNDQLAAAFGTLEAGGAPGTAVAGVIPYVLDQDRQELSADSQVSVSTDAQEFALNLFEGYGPAGLWSLEIDNIDLRNITDVRLKLNLLIPESSGQLQARVRELVHDYETELSGENQLDRITAISLFQQRRDTFFAMANGPASFVLNENDFPAGITDLNVKCIVVQAIDFDGEGAEGVSFTFSKNGEPFILERVTAANGFSEDVSAELPSLEPADRFSVFGTWQITLADATQFNTIFNNSAQQKVGDLVIYYIYDFIEL